MYKGSSIVQAVLICLAGILVVVKLFESPCPCWGSLGSYSCSGPDVSSCPTLLESIHSYTYPIVIVIFLALIMLLAIFLLFEFKRSFTKGLKSLVLSVCTVAIVMAALIYGEPCPLIWISQGAGLCKMWGATL